MRALVQRVKKTSLCVNGEEISSIPFGFAVFLGIGCGDKEEAAEKLAKKIYGMRIFEDAEGKMNLSLKDVGGEILLVSQFTLYGDCSRGYRPSFSSAEEPRRAKELYLYLGKKLEELGATVKYGVFGADMQIDQHNDGPVSIFLEL